MKTKEHKKTSERMLVLKEKASCLTRGPGGPLAESYIPRGMPRRS